MFFGKFIVWILRKQQFLPQSMSAFCYCSFFGIFFFVLKVFGKKRYTNNNKNNYMQSIFSLNLKKNSVVVLEAVDHESLFGRLLIFTCSDYGKQNQDWETQIASHYLKKSRKSAPRSPIPSILQHHHHFCFLNFMVVLFLMLCFTKNELEEQKNHYLFFILKNILN